MQVTIRKAVLSGEIKAIASKSHAHRLLICAALSQRPSRILCSETSQDIEATADCLRAFGAQIRQEAECFAVEPVWENLQRDRKLYCRESGSTLRFLLPVSCALGGHTQFYGEGRLPQRPLSPLYEQLQLHGCTLSLQGHNPLDCRGNLCGGNYQLPGNVSSQFVSGLLFALPLLKEKSTLQLTGKVESLPYIRMTLQALEQTGIYIRQREQSFEIGGNQSYQAPEDCIVEGDWSNAAFWLCAGALQGDGICCNGLRADSLQGDRQVLSLLKQFGAQVEQTEDACSVAPALLHGIEIDAGNIPDLVPILSVVACAAQGQTRIYNAGRLRIKESDRLQTVYEVLRALGAELQMQEDGFLIQGNGMLRGGMVQAHGDHRIAMMAAIASCLCTEPVIICGAEAVNKSYPGFFADMRLLGAQLEEERE